MPKLINSVSLTFQKAFIVDETDMDGSNYGRKPIINWKQSFVWVKHVDEDEKKLRQF